MVTCHPKVIVVLNVLHSIVEMAEQCDFFLILNLSLADQQALT